MTIDVVFLDKGFASQCKADPRYPDGMPINLAKSGIQKTCTRNLPYPAPRCGIYVVKCNVCGFQGAITVAGRADDPNMVTMPCKAGGLNS